MSNRVRPPRSVYVAWCTGCGALLGPYTKARAKTVALVMDEGCGDCELSRAGDADMLVARYQLARSNVFGWSK